MEGEGMLLSSFPKATLTNYKKKKCWPILDAKKEEKKPEKNLIKSNPPTNKSSFSVQKNQNDSQQNVGEKLYTVLSSHRKSM